jgi:hypothetical protein
MTPRQPGIWAFAVAFLFMPLGCKKPANFERGDLTASILCSSLPEYFPLPNSGTGDLFYGGDQAKWEGNYLQHMKEPPLYACGSSLDTQPVYRFLWDRSLSKPIAVRLTVRPNGAGTLYVRELAHCCLMPPPKQGQKAQTWDEWLTLETDRAVDLDVDQTRRLTSLFDAVFHHPFDRNPIGNTSDGSDWIFESRVHGRYRLRDFRNVPPESAKTLGLMLVRDLGRVPIHAQEIY